MDRYFFSSFLLFLSRTLRSLQNNFPVTSIMSSLNQHHDPVPTVRLRPFNEHHWYHRLTYRPMITEWTETLFVDKQRSRTGSPRKYSSKQLTVADPIDLETLKLDDEILLNELHDMKQSVTVSTLRDKYRSRHGLRTTSPTIDYRASLAETFYQRDGVCTPLRHPRQSSSLRSQPTPEHFELSKPVVRHSFSPCASNCNAMLM